MTNREYMNRLIVLAATARAVIARCEEAIDIWTDALDGISATQPDTLADADLIERRYREAFDELKHAMNSRDRAQASHDKAMDEIAGVIDAAIAFTADNLG